MTVLSIQTWENLFSYILRCNYSKFLYSELVSFPIAASIFWSIPKNTNSSHFCCIWFIFDISVDILYAFFLLISKHKYKNLNGLLQSFFNIIAWPVLSKVMIFYIIWLACLDFAFHRIAVYDTTLYTWSDDMFYLSIRKGFCNLKFTDRNK